MFHSFVRTLAALFERSRTGPVGLTARTLNSGPVIFGALAAVVPFAFAQSRELYLRIVGDGDVVRAAFGLGGVLLLCATLHAWNYHLLNRRIDELYPDHARIGIDKRLKDVRNFNALFCAMLPLIGVVLGQLWLLREVVATKSLIGWSAVELTTHLYDVSWGLVLLISINIALGLLLLLVLDRFPGTPLLTTSWLIGLAVLLAPMLPEAEVLGLARLLGPLCVFSLVAIGLIALVRFFTNLVRFLLVLLLVPLTLFFSRRLQGSLLSVAGLSSAAAVLVVSALMNHQLFDTIRHVPGGPTIATSEPAQPSLDDAFDRWLAARGLVSHTSSTQSRPYPIFVIAAQGGGIYAASLAMTFLSSVQDQCPNFARHVFAISAVSGGAIGASIFQGLAEDNGDISCLETPRRQLSRIARGVAGDDHLSSLLLSTPIDWLSKLFGVQTAHRASALRYSFEESYQRWASPQHDSLATRFDEHWNPTSPTLRAALLLNTTSAETGERVAFAPFSLLSVGSGTLLSFSDLSRALRLNPSTSERLRSTSIIDAAITSARFPGILPAWPLLHHGLLVEPGETRQLNFVDGGYADSSGANTAADVLERLRQIIETKAIGDRVSLHLILLTDTDTTIDLAHAKGSNFVDTLAPVSALMAVRQLTARRAVAQAVAELRARRVGVLTLEIDHRIFPLPLGWTLSPTSNLLIKEMVASPTLCFSLNPEPDSPETKRFVPDRLTRLVHRNSCERAKVIDLLTR